jgi:hypothetical protein
MSLGFTKSDVDHNLYYKVVDEVRLQGYTDSDWAWSAVDRKSTSG